MKKRLALTAGLMVSLTLNIQAEDRAALPKVLIIGDSISIGYTKPLAEILVGKASVSHNPGNATHSGNGRAKLDQWLGDTKWDVIHFNHGLHDLKYVDENGKNTTSKEIGHIQIPLEQYELNLEAIVVRLKETGGKLIFATTTPYPDRPTGPLREAGQAEKYNEVALRVMASHDVVVNDLYAFMSTRLKEFQRPNNVHFKPEGSMALAEQVAKHILAAIGEQPPVGESLKGARNASFGLVLDK